MDDCHAILGIHPAAGSDEIEEAWRRKKSEWDPDRFEEGSSGREEALAMQRRLEQAYNDAIMASFAPIRAFSVQNSPPVAPAGKAQVQTQKNLSAPETPKPEPMSPELLKPKPKPKSPSRPAAAKVPDVIPANEAPIRSTWVPRGKSELDGLVEEVPVSFSDDDLLNMDISQLRETYAPPQKAGSSLLTLGIEDPLLRSYVWMYLSFTLFDFLMRLVMGNAWNAGIGILARYSRVAGEVLSTGMGTAPSSSVLWSLTTSIVSMAYLFACSLVMPIIVRFFILSAPMEKVTMRWMVNIASIVAAYIIMLPLGLLFRILPAEWAGSSTNLLFVTPLLCGMTLKYGGK